jgi:hypothetical protein
MRILAKFDSEILATTWLLAVKDKIEEDTLEEVEPPALFGVTKEPGSAYFLVTTPSKGARIIVSLIWAITVCKEPRWELSSARAWSISSFLAPALIKLYDCCNCLTFALACSISSLRVPAFCNAKACFTSSTLASR